jgi:hypothetical protein
MTCWVAARFALISAIFACVGDVHSRKTRSISGPNSEDLENSPRRLMTERYFPMNFVRIWSTA